MRSALSKRNRIGHSCMYRRWSHIRGYRFHYSAQQRCLYVIWIIIIYTSPRERIIAGFTHYRLFVFDTRTYFLIKYYIFSRAEMRLRIDTAFREINSKRARWAHNKSIVPPIKLKGYNTINELVIYVTRLKLTESFYLFLISNS